MLQESATRVDFYVLESSDVQSRLHFACKLIEKVYKLGHQLRIRTASKAESEELDQLLWTARGGSFIPHELAGDSNSGLTPIIISHSAAADDSAANDVLFNLGTAMPGDYQQYTRVIELIDAADEIRQAGRQRFGAYREAGIKPETHKIGSSANQ